ncbi:MAG: peptide-methionine (S)-S-oxide reductase MsrA [Haloferacaceae archaeon]
MSLTPTLVEECDDDAPRPADTETATFGLGCFWGPDARFGAHEGVVRTRVGYAGGTKPDPRYHALGDHTEVVQVDYDPNRCPYRALLARAFEMHDPHHQAGKTQYRNVVLTASDAQRETLAAYLADNGYDPDGIATDVERLSRFHPAEPYHQKYSLRSNASLLGTLEDAGYGDERLRESPAAAKLNAVAAGHELPADDSLRVALDGTAGDRRHSRRR